MRLRPRALAASGAVCTLVLLLLSCGGDERAPAPDAGAREPPAPSASPPEPGPEPPAVEHTVGEGETLWDIARAYGVSVDEIMEANRMSHRDVRRLRAGSTIRIPGAREAVAVPTAEDRAREREALPELDDGAYHFVAQGETVWDLARLYDKTVDEIMERNGFDDEAVRAVRPGQAVIIPGVRASQIRRREPEREETRGIRHAVEPGETVWDLANAFQVSVAEIMAANGLSATEVTRLSTGTRLFIPGVSEDRRGRVRRQVTGAQRTATALARRLALGTRQVASDLLRGRVRRPWIRAAGDSARMPGTLQWPVTNGRFVRGYGSGEGGYHLAVDVAGDIGWNVRAAAPGIVGYSGNEIRGYGNIVLLIHPGGWVTMYAHNSSNFVVAGQRVPRGGILAEVGSTGISRGPHVHFEFMYDGRNCDPAVLFRPGARHRSGRVTPLDYTTWTVPDRRPEAVRCAPRRRFPRSRWVIDEDSNDDGG